jgi:hypothetical protein
MAAALIDDAMRRVGGDAGCQFDDALRRRNEILFLPGSNTLSGAIQVGPPSGCTPGPVHAPASPSVHRRRTGFPPSPAARGGRLPRSLR